MEEREQTLQEDQLLVEALAEAGVFVKTSQDLLRAKTSYPNAELEYSLGTTKGVSTLAHEVVHTFDYRARGVAGFLSAYGLEANDKFVQTGSLDKAYSELSFEVRANEVQGLVTKFLDQNPDIQAKLAKGEALTKQEAARVTDYSLRQVSKGVLREGFQFVDGYLVYVRLTAQ
jgi:hypothetical protein